MEDFRIVKSQYNEYSVERLNRNTPRKWVPCGDLRNPICPLPEEYSILLEPNRKIYDSYEEAAQAISEHNNPRQWSVVFGGVEMGEYQCDCCRKLNLEGYWTLQCLRGEQNCIGSIRKIT